MNGADGWMIPVTLIMSFILVVLKAIEVLNIEWWQCSIPILVCIAWNVFILVATIIIIVVGAVVHKMWVKMHEYRDN